MRLATPAARDFKGASPTKKMGASATLADNLLPSILPGQSANPQVWMDDGIFAELGGVGVDAPAWLAGIRRSGWWDRNHPPNRAGIDGKRIKGRRECINHYGAACTPMQALPMALRIKYLAGILDRDL